MLLLHGLNLPLELPHISLTLLLVSLNNIAVSLNGNLHLILHFDQIFLKFLLVLLQSLAVVNGRVELSLDEFKLKEDLADTDSVIL